MDRKYRILIVEDDMIIAANLSLQLTKLGYEVTGIESRGEDALHHASLNIPDIILMDVNLKGQWDGIETVSRIQGQQDIAIVYLTANNDEATFLRAKKHASTCLYFQAFQQTEFATHYSSGSGKAQRFFKSREPGISRIRSTGRPNFCKTSR